MGDDAKASAELVSLQVERYRDPDGNPTCAIDFDTDKVCRFYRTGKFGLTDTCVFAKGYGVQSFTSPSDLSDVMFRRGPDGLGLLIPLYYCPVWSDEAAKKETR